MTAADHQGLSGLHKTFYRIVQCIPEGRVATYGQIADLAERPRNARQVGNALARLGVCAAERGEASSETQGHGEDGMGRKSESARRFGAGDDSVPWHRVVNARGEVSERGLDPLESVDRQRFFLKEEGIVFDRCGRIDLDRFGWAP